MPAEKIPGWIERLLLPKLSELDGDGEIKAVNTRIYSVNERIDSLRNETKSEFTGLNYRFDSLENRIPVIGA